MLGKEVAKDLRCLGFLKIKKIFRNSDDLIQYLKKINTRENYSVIFQEALKTFNS